MADSGPLDPDGGGKLLALDWRPPDRVVRQFGAIAAVLLPFVAWWWLGRPGPAAWTPKATTWVAGGGAAGLALALLGGVRPALLRPVFVVLCVVAYPLGLVLSAVLLRLVYYVAFAPLALWFRWRGRDALQLRFDPAAETYWQPRPAAKDAKDYFRQW